MLELVLTICISVAVLYLLIQISKCTTGQYKKDKAGVNKTAADKKESFCTCQGLGRKTCNNPQVMQALYNTNTLTEYTDLRKLQDTSVWKNAAPYDRFYQYNTKYNSCGQQMKQ